MISCHASGFDSTIAETITARSGHARFTSAISRRFCSSGRSEINSTLLIASIFCPPECQAPYLLDTFSTGAPIVFHTAPPQPASNARCTCAPEFDGGAEASQNGFGERMPAKLIDRSATAHQPFVNRPRRNFAVLHRHHRRCGAYSTNTISARIDSRQACLQSFIHRDVAPVELQVQPRCQ